MDKIMNMSKTIANTQLNNNDYWPEYMQTTKYYKWHRTTILNDSAQWKLILDSNDIIPLDNKYGQPLYITARMHPHWPILYNTILECKPQSFFEVGMGAANHLINVYTCAKKMGLQITHLGGCELSPDQYRLGCDMFKVEEVFNDTKYDSYIEDFLMAQINDVYDVVYDTTVLMHVPKDYVLPFIDKMTKMALKKVVFFDWYYEGYKLKELVEYSAQYGKVSLLDSENLKEHRKTDKAASCGFIINLEVPHV